MGTFAPVPELLARSALPGHERRRILSQAESMLEGIFAHLPLKAARHAVNATQEIRLLQTRAEALNDLAFHERLIDIFTRLRDRHTSYQLSRLGLGLATLPFRVERCLHEGRTAYVASSIGSGSPDVDFKDGVEVTHWNGIPIARAVELNGSRLPGGNADAQRAMGERFLTQRPLARYLLPDEEWVRITFVAADGRRDIEFRWEGLNLPADAAPALGPRQLVGRGCDELLSLVNRAQRSLFAPASFDRQAARVGSDEAPLLDNFEFRPVATSQGTFGYIRIYDFDVDVAEQFLADFVRILGRLPPDGLIIDIRDNPGGYIKAGQLLLQTLTPQRIRPGHFHLRNTRLTLEMCERNEPLLRKWLPSVRQATGTGALFSQGFPIEDNEVDYNRIGQQYHGPVVLITSALSYSTSDIVAADFRDHAIGRILGVDGNMGAGGANNWPHWLLRLFNPGFQLDSAFEEDLETGAVTSRLREALELRGVVLSPAVGAIVRIPQSWGVEWRLADRARTYFFRRAEWMNSFLNVYFEGDGSLIQDLPAGVSLGVSFRMSTRTGASEGLPLEDLGIEPDAVHQITRRDLIEKNADLIEHAARLLASMPRYLFQASVEASGPEEIAFRLETQNLDRVDVYLEGRPVASRNLCDGVHSVTVAAPPGAAALRLEGFRNDALVAAKRMSRLPAEPSAAAC